MLLKGLRGIAYRAAVQSSRRAAISPYLRPMRAYHALVASAAILILALGAMDVLNGGWDAVAGGLGLLSAMASPLAFAVLAARAERTRV